MIIKAKNSIYKKSNINQGVLLDVEIIDINTYFNRFDNTLNFTFGVFHYVDSERILVDTLFLTLSNNTAREGKVSTPDIDGSGNNTQLIEQYFAEKGTLAGVNVLDYGMPSIELAKTFFTGGNSLDNPEIQPTNELAKIWLLNTLKFDGKLIAENFEFAI